MHGRHKTPSYFSIQDIMVTQEKIPCRARLPLPGLGFLSADKEEEDLSKNAVVNIPMWLIITLVRKDLKLLSPEVPIIFREKSRDVFEADATVINLFKLSPKYYEYGWYFAELGHRESELIRQFLMEVFRSRILLIVEWAVFKMSETSKIQQLESSEQKLLKSMQSKVNEIDGWFVEVQAEFKAAQMVNKHKRRLIQCDSSTTSTEPR